VPNAFIIGVRTPALAAAKVTLMQPDAVSLPGPRRRREKTLSVKRRNFKPAGFEKRVTECAAAFYFNNPAAN